MWSYDSRFGSLESSGDDTDGDGAADSAFVTQVFAATDPTIVDYEIDRAYTRNADEFFALFSAPTPREDAQHRGFGTREHDIGFVLAAAVPVLDPALDWHRPVSSADPRIDSWTPHRDWSDIRGVAFYNIDGTPPELPHIANPEGDFVQNCNGSPTWVTEPTGQIETPPVTLEAYDTPTRRDLRMRELVLSSDPLDAAGVQEIATDVQVLAALHWIEAIRCGLAASGTDPVSTWGDGGTLMQLLLDWSDTGYRALPDSEAMTVMFLADAQIESLVYPALGTCYSAEQLEAVGVALRDIVAPSMRRYYSSSHADPLHVPWGHLNYEVVGGIEYGLPGAGGRLVTLFVDSTTFDTDTGRMDPASRLGSRVTQVTSFGPAGHQVFITSPHGQSSELRTPSSPHIGQTIEDFAARRFRRVPLSREEVEADLCPYGDPTSPEYDPEHEHPTRTELVFVERAR
jgi:hypothetical protein